MRIINLKKDCLKKSSMQIIAVFLLIAVSTAVSAQFSPHNVEGRVFTNGSNGVQNGVQNGIPVTINNTISKDFVITYTDAPDIPELRGSYSGAINGSDDDLIIVTAWNSTHYGANTSKLISTTTNINIVINLTRSSEANVTIIIPANNSLKNSTNIFNVTANISMLGNDGTGCNATIFFSNNAAINITADQNFTNQLGNVAFGAWELTTWNVTALSESISDITVSSQCSSDGKILEGLNRYTISIRINDTAPTVNASINNTAPKYGEIVNFTANVSDEIGLSLCQFIDNQSAGGAKRFFNLTVSGIQDKCSKSFETLVDGGVINFSLIVNNTGNYKKQKEFIITAAGVPPRWQNLEINDSHAEQFDFVAFNATWTDNFNLSSYIFSINSTGRWVNMSAAGFSGAVNYSNFTMQVNASPNSVVGWAFYASDVSGNFNATNVSTFIIVPQYHIFYGEINTNIVLDTSQNLSIMAWINSSNVKGNVYVTDADTLNGISWTSLQAIGKDKSLNDAQNDWENIDSLLGMDMFNDSINRTFTSGSQPKNKTDFTVLGSQISNVSTVNSTNTSNFVTGILWDTSDSADAQYDTSEKEDLVFLTRMNGRALGSYGYYHYEIRVPARLKQYRAPNNQDSLSFYVELI